MTPLVSEVHSRVEKNNRCSIAKKQLGSLGSVACPPTCLSEDRNWRRVGCWTLDTGNGNSWRTFENCILARSQVDIVLGQESKILGFDRICSSRSAARALGWSPSLTEANRTSSDRGSGGNSVLARKGSGIIDITKDVFKQAYRQKICVSWLDAVVRGDIYIISLWLRD